MKLVDFLNNDKLMAEYTRWINEDIGHIVFGMLQENFCRPKNISDEIVNSSTSERELGRYGGLWEMLDAVRDLGSLEAVAEDMPEESYGTETKEKENKDV